MSKKNILQLIKYYKGNAPLLNSMVKPDSEELSTVVCYLGGSDDGLNQMENVAAKTVYCNIPKRKINWTRSKTLKRLVQIIDQNHIDLVVCQFRRTIPIGVIAAGLSTRKPKVIAVLHGIVGGKVGWGRKLVNYFVFKRLAKIVSVSEYGIEDIVRLNLGLARENIVAIQNGLVCQPFLSKSTRTRSELFPSLPDNAFIFAMVGRLAPVKNHVRVLHAFRKVIDREAQAYLLMAGTGPLETQLKTIVEEEGLQRNVIFLGFRRDVPDILHNIDAYLMPSLREGLPMALMEAMVCGLPVITSETTGMRELIPDETLGYLLNPNSIESIANTMLDVIASKEGERCARGQRARARILENFTATAMANRYENLYREILALNS